MTTIKKIVIFNMVAYGNSDWVKTSPPLARIFLSIGSNLGQRDKNIFRAINLLNQNNIYIKQVSNIYETNPVGGLSMFGSKVGFNFKLPNFLNCVVEAVTHYQPYQVLLIVHQVEKSLGRQRIAFIKNLPRTIDIDILFYDNKIFNDSKLTIPHPRINERAFVLVPLSEIAPDFIHPQYNKTIQSLTNRIDKKGVRIWQHQPITILS